MNELEQSRYEIALGAAENYRARAEKAEAAIRTFAEDCGWDIPNLDDFGLYEIDGMTLKALLAKIQPAARTGKMTE